ncbi:hypothetical protein MTO96_034644 [Rhipicephalus appendiculatus]
MFKPSAAKDLRSKLYWLSVHKWIVESAPPLVRQMNTMCNTSQRSLTDWGSLVTSLGSLVMAGSSNKEECQDDSPPISVKRQILHWIKRHGTVARNGLLASAAIWAAVKGDEVTEYFCFDGIALFSAIKSMRHFIQKQLAPDTPCWLKMTYVAYIGAVLTLGHYCLSELPALRWMINVDIVHIVLHAGVLVYFFTNWVNFGNLLRQILRTTGDGALFTGEVLTNYLHNWLHRLLWPIFFCHNRVLQAQGSTTQLDGDLSGHQGDLHQVVSHPSTPSAPTIAECEPLLDHLIPQNIEQYVPSEEVISDQPRNAIPLSQMAGHSLTT